MGYEGLDLRAVYRRALDVVGAERLLFGSDSSFFPRGWNDEILRQQTTALYELGIEREQAAQILHTNLETLHAEAIGKILSKSSPVLVLCLCGFHACSESQRQLPQACRRCSRQASVSRLGQVASGPTQPRSALSIPSCRSRPNGGLNSKPIARAC